MNIRVAMNTPIKDGTEVLFRSPVDCSQVTGLIVYYPENGATASKEFAFADAHGNNVGDIDHLFAENVVVKVILDVTTGMAFVQNADTNAYLEGRFAEVSVDDATVSGKPWSSKNIVDKLCPTFTETGAEVKCHPVQGYPLGVISQITPAQQGDGSPSPDNVRAITGWDKFSVNLVGEDSGMLYFKSSPQVDGFFLKIYGGTYNWTSGVLTVDWVKVTINGGMKQSDGNAMQYIVPHKPFYNSGVASCVCSHYPSFGWGDLYKIRNDADAQGVAMTSEVFRFVDNVQFNGDVAEANKWLAENPIEVAYKLAEPVTYQLEPQEILALPGENTLVSNTGDTTVSGRADPTVIIEKLTNAILAMGGNV